MERITNKGRSDSEADLLGLFSWPPRSYTCTFCKREFRSAQALGGHMNVHRRDRARLRQSPPLIIRDHHHHHLLNLNLDPNPSFPCRSPRGPKPPRFSFVPPSVSTISTTPLASTGTATGKATNKRYLEVEKVHHDDEKEKERSCLGKLELEIGLVSEEGRKEEVDLELRLGYI